MAVTDDARFDDLVDRAWDAYRDGEAELGASLATDATRLRPDDGTAWYAFAACLERAGRLAEADRAFQRAATATADPQPSPYRIPWRRFREIVDLAVADLPDRLAAAFAEVSLVLADYAEPELIASFGEPELLGLFEGAPRAERSPTAPPETTPTIYLFRRAHEHHCCDLLEMKEEVRRTLYHEFGHYLGYDEDGLDELGMG